MKEITPTNIKLLRDEIRDTLQALGKQYGVKIIPGKAKYSATMVTFDLEVAIVNADGSAETRTRTDFKNFAIGYGMQPDWLDKQFVVPFSNKRYQILGLMPQSHKYPVLCKCLRTGKEFKLQAYTVIEGMKKMQAE